MRALLVEQYDSIENIQIGEVETPAIAAGQVLVKVQAAGVGFAEGLKVRGLYQTKDPLPFTPGMEFAGVVVAVADDVEGLAPGARVMGNVTNGALAEYVAANASNLYLMPDGVTPEVGASFYISYVTGLYALQGRAWLKSGERLRVLGAAGGTAEENTVYFANVYLVLSTASLFLQLVVAPWLQRAAGIRRTLLVLPVALFGGAATVLFMGTLMARAGLRVMEGGLKAGVHRTSWEQAYMAFPKEARATTKVLVDGLGARVAEGVAGLGLHLLLLFAAGGIGGSLSAVPWIATVSAAWVTAALVLSAACWAALTWALARRLRAATAHDEDARMRATLPDS